MKIFSSLRAQLLIPLLLGSLLVALIMTLIAYWIADLRANKESRERLSSITKVISNTNFPLTENVMQMLAGLTDAYWVKLDSQERVVEFVPPLATSSHSAHRPLNRTDLETAQILKGPSEEIQVAVEGRFYSAVFVRNQSHRANQGEQSYDLLVMLDNSRQNLAVWQAAFPPFLTGLATIVLIGSLSLLLSERFVQRIAKLQREVDHIAAGNIELPPYEMSYDEIDKLAFALRAMSHRLDQMWSALRRNHSQQLINQIASGLAHNLRNTLTGARLAVELIIQSSIEEPTKHGAGAESTVAPQDSRALHVAIDQIKIAEQYIQRLLWMAKGRDVAPAKPMAILDCLSNMKAGLENTAAHRSVQIQWEFDRSLEQSWVGNGTALLSAVSNLVWNAMEAANVVWIRAGLLSTNQTCQIDVIDNGHGPIAEIQLSMFEPFVSAKTEGIGLGLPLVRQAAESMSGTIEWFRQNNCTVFRLQFPVTDEGTY